MYILRNKTQHDIEINELGITITPNLDHIIENEIFCNELTPIIERGDIVFVDSAGKELTQEKTKNLYNSINKPVYESGYTRDEIDQKFAELVGSATSTLDTLNELANAIGDDPNFATTILEELSNKASLNHIHPYAPEIHNHNDLYNTKQQIQTLLALKSNIGHDHDADYSNIRHNHDRDYSNIEHNHDGRYIKPNELPVFGQNFHFISDKSVSTTTQSLIKKSELIVDIKVDGLYRIGWNYNWNYDSTSYDFIANIKINDLTIMEHRQEPKDSAGRFGNTGTDQRVPVCGFDIIKLNPGKYSITLSFGSSKNKYRASMWNTTLEFWRVQ